jgi:hypothetical protein
VSVPPAEATPPPAQPAAPEPAFSPEAFAATGGGETFAAAAPQMIGDFLGGVGTIVQNQSVTLQQTILVKTINAFGKVVFVPRVISTPAVIAHTTTFPIIGPGPFKISDNQSPTPGNRVYFDVRNYSGVPSTSNVAFDPIPAVAGSASIVKANVTVETIGIEKTILSDNFSVGLRVPFIQLSGGSSTNNLNGPVFVPGVGSTTTLPAIVSDQSQVGDLSAILKYAFYNDRRTGNVICGGLVVTAPTGPSIPIAVPGPGGTFTQGSIDPVLLQPFAGALYNINRAYVQGFSSISVPTESQFVTLAFNDIGIGYWLYRNSSGLVSSVVPTFETHINTPLDHRQPGGSIFVPDIVDMTCGAHVGIGRHAIMTFAVGAPVTGPKPFDVEGIAQLNYRW